MDNDTQDTQIAAEALPAATAGDGDSQIYVAIGLVYGPDGFEKDECQGLDWFRRAAAQDHPQALYNLAWLQEFTESVPADPTETERLYRLAAVPGH